MPLRSLFLRTLLLLLSCFASVAACAQADTSRVDSTAQIPFVANWAVGDSFRYAITEITVSYVGDSTTTNDTVRYEADFIVADSTAEEYIVIWDTNRDQDDFAEFYENTDAAFQDSIDMLGDLRIRFRTNELGQYGGIANAAEMREAMQVIAPRMTRYFLDQDTTMLQYMDERQKTVFTKFAAKKIMDEFTPAVMEAEFMVPVVHLLAPLGAQYMLHDTTEASVDIASKLPGESVLQHVRLYFDDFFPEDGYVHMKVFTQIDDADGVLLLAKSLRQKGHDENKIQDFVQNGFYREREDNDFYYFYGYGLAEGVDCFKEVTTEVPGEERVVNIQQYIIEIIRPKAEE